LNCERASFKILGKTKDISVSSEFSTQEVSIKAFLKAADHAGVPENFPYRWLEEYDGPGYYGRKTQGEDNLRVAYNHLNSVEFLEGICVVCGVAPSTIAHASRIANALEAPVNTQAKEFRRLIPWEDVADGAQAFIDNHLAGAAHRNQLLAVSEEEKDVADIRASEKLNETEKQALINARRGQGAFREAVSANWNHACAVTNCSQREVLRASHIKPWRSSSNDERLNPSNGLLLSANLDALFDRGLISFDAKGRMLLSHSIHPETIEILGLPAHLRRAPDPDECAFLKHHQAHIFRP
jgi:hypothetical protein